MDTRPRADLGFGDALDSFDPEQWDAGPARPAPLPHDRQRTRQSAEALGFHSREVRAGETAPVGQGADTDEQEAQPPVRRRRTGRNRQFNLKARSETVEAYCRIADARGWGLGETLEHAVALLEERYGRDVTRN